ncbi:XisH family protein [Tautonia plasticadhaerens]|uniref:XisH protein n=1 Tax=Tautonia plasticadhaerens TaxID=2527974 RepID=A0A518H162_9BACT|nr:XisH family protein [Tautonia plasticadhaerens]QDV34585.1 XisH protein [Tautonia plasticadhaerens]
MPARDFYHDTVRNALLKDGWTITDDPFTIKWGGRNTFVDLAAERLISAEKEGERIAVEIKSFVGASELADFETALGQYCVYLTLLERVDPGRRLYLAIPQEVAEGLFLEPIGQVVIERYAISLISFDPNTETILRWKT